MGDGARHHPHAGASRGHASPAARMGDGVERGGGVGRPARPRGAARVRGRDGVEPDRRLARHARSSRPRRDAAGSPRCRSCSGGWPRRSSRGRSASRGTPRQRALAPHERAQVRRLARKTWHYFETFVGPDDHWLPPDNFQEAPGRQLARRTSPTNIGMGLLSTLAARDLGFIDDRELIDADRPHAGHLRGARAARGASAQLVRHEHARAAVAALRVHGRQRQPRDGPGHAGQRSRSARPAPRRWAAAARRGSPTPPRSCAAWPPEAPRRRLPCVALHERVDTVRLGHRCRPAGRRWTTGISPRAPRQHIAALDAVLGASRTRSPPATATNRPC